MRISVTIFIILISTYVVNASVLDPVIENVIHLKATKPPPGVSGIWKKKTIWKPRWVKEWKSAKVMKPVWRKVWSPIQIREWLPIPKPPPGWDLHSTPLAKIQPQKTLPIDNQVHDSSSHHSTKLPLWDPVPYPESQQPPPIGYDPTCGQNCDSSSSQTFNQQQILEIIGKHTSEQYQDYSESVNHLTRLPPDGNNWRAPQDFSRLPEFLVPPKFQSNFQQPFSNPPPFEPVPKWSPLPENKIKGHFITKDQPYKFQIPEPGNNSSSVQQKEKPNFQTNNTIPLHADGDFIQEAQLVGEYHYSELDVRNVKQQQAKVKQQESVPSEREKEKEERVHVQKKHIPNLNIQQQDAIIKEIFPIFKNQNQSTKLHPVTTNPPPVQQDKVYPVYEGTTEKIQSPSNETRQLAPEKTSPDKGSIVQLVFATNTPVEEPRKSTTTEAYEVIFSSSLQSTTEPISKGHVVVVTPANSGMRSV